VVSERLERAMSDLDREIRAAVPDVTEVFLDPTPARDD
jgi:Glu-tRNA(Gln) amidotransferase subunit E-like FAD-binding protein